MADIFDLNKKSGDLATLVQRRLGIRAQSPAQALGRAVRHLPRRARRSARVIETALQYADHPKLSKMQDPATLDAAFAEVTECLMQVDLAARRRGRLLDLLASLAFILVVIAGLLIWWLNWRGYL